MSQSKYVKVHTLPRLHTMASDEENWWEKLLAPVPPERVCSNPNCKFAPVGHRKHPPLEAKFTTFEDRLIIKYLVHFDVIEFGKGLSVWETMNTRGYLTNRSPQSLNNHFKRYLLRDIEGYRLPADLQLKFTALRSR